MGFGHSPVLERTLTTIIIAFIATKGFLGRLGGFEKLEAYSMSVQLSIVAALLLGIFIYDYNFIQSERSLVIDYQDKSWIAKISILCGILLVVQGFETSRLLGEKYSAEIRVKTMRRAQLISGALCVVSVAALMPIVQHLSLENIQIADIVSATGLAATALPLMLIVAAIMSQFSAAVADTVGAGCLASESSWGEITDQQGVCGRISLRNHTDIDRRLAGNHLLCFTCFRTVLPLAVRICTHGQFPSLPPQGIPRVSDRFCCSGSHPGLYRGIRYPGEIDDDKRQSEHSCRVMAAKVKSKTKGGRSPQQWMQLATPFSFGC